MNWINRYILETRYVDGGRGPVEYDCWGLVREARHLHCGMRLLPSWGEIRNTEPKAFTKAYIREARDMVECGHEHGAIAAAMDGKICIHVGLALVVSGRKMVLEINPGGGAKLVRMLDFETAYKGVIYYRD